MACRAITASGYSIAEGLPEEAVVPEWKTDLVKEDGSEAGMGIGDPQGEALELATRNFGLKSGVTFRDSIELEGWENQSWWGWDPPSDSFFAQLWKNESTNEAPDLWISGVRRRMPSPESIVSEMTERLRYLPCAIMDALGLRDPNPVLPSREAIADRLRLELDQVGVVLSDENPQYDYTEDLRARGLDGRTIGTLTSLLWLAGRQLVSPASFIDFPPIGGAICAERLVATGWLYLEPPDEEYTCAVYRTLRWDGSST